MKKLSDDESITFHFVQGYLEWQPPQWLTPALEDPPRLRFFQWDENLLDYGAHVEKHGITQLKNFIWGTDTVEEKRKEDKPRSTPYTDFPPEPWSVSVALEYLHNIMEDEGPFHGIIGVSEGACVAATLLVEDIQACKAKQTKSDFRCGLFYIGTPAWSADGMRAILPDEDGQVIDIPTCHVMGVRDVFKVGAELLRGICDEDRALIISDPGGHRIPQDAPTNEQIADWIREQERGFAEECSREDSHHLEES